MHEAVTRYKANRRRKGQPVSRGGTLCDRDYMWVEAECRMLLDTKTSDDDLTPSMGWLSAEEIRRWPGGAEVMMAWRRRDPAQLVAWVEFVAVAELLDACNEVGMPLTKEQAVALTRQQRETMLEDVLDRGRRRGLTAV
jgi:hypothetical protein